MHLLFHKVFFGLWFCVNNLAVTASELKSTTYINKLEFQDKVCLASDRIFIGPVASTIVCGYLCFNMADCKGFSFSPTDLACTGCTKSYNTASQLDELSGNLFFTPYALTCAEPVIVDTNVKLDPCDGISQIGDKVNYTCTPCTFVPMDEPAVITCLPNGTWSMPKCKFGPDVGRLINGYPIPSGVTGCVSNFNNTCLQLVATVDGDNALRYDGSQPGQCFCNNGCCEYRDCCFDHWCP